MLNYVVQLQLSKRVNHAISKGANVTPNFSPKISPEVRLKGGDEAMRTVEETVETVA